jgi:hypothetical protein
MERPVLSNTGHFILYIRATDYFVLPTFTSSGLPILPD